MRPVVLIGFMGAGKTTVGRALAGILHCRFQDLDDLIEQRERQAVAEIFATAGEAGFRQAESAALRDVLRDDLLQNDPVQEQAGRSDLVLALGGGAFVQPLNRTLLEQSGAVTVLLEAPLEELRRRCQSEHKVRPLALQEASFAELFAARRDDYLLARYRVQTLGKPVEQVAAEIAQLLTEVIQAEVEK
ncbi:MAG TPA: shikimate kinase [Candidatus Angelobacter sp.]|nr:shikimate kinase [Candidatus Angelobacter sp.]